MKQNWLICSKTIRLFFHIRCVPVWLLTSSGRPNFPLVLILPTIFRGKTAAVRFSLNESVLWPMQPSIKGLPHLVDLLANHPVRLTWYAEASRARNLPIQIHRSSHRSRIFKKISLYWPRDLQNQGTASGATTSFSLPYIINLLESSLRLSTCTLSRNNRYFATRLFWSPLSHLVQVISLGFSEYLWRF